MGAKKKSARAKRRRPVRARPRPSATVGPYAPPTSRGADAERDSDRTDATPVDQADNDDAALIGRIGRGVVSPILHDDRRRKEMGLPADPEEPGPYLVELNVQYRDGLAAAASAFDRLWTGLFGPRSTLSRAKQPPRLISKSYIQVKLAVPEWLRLVAADERRARAQPQGSVTSPNQRRAIRDASSRRVIYKLWPDFRVKPLIDRSVATVKADAAFNAYSASGAGIVWAVVDSGIDGKHPHFGSRAPNANLGSVLHHPQVAKLHRDFSRGGDRDARGALVDGYGHGTHVAGIISGGLSADAEQTPLEGVTRRSPARRGRARPPRYAVYEQVFASNEDGTPRPGRAPRRRRVHDPTQLRGVAPQCLLVSLKVMDDQGMCRVSDVMRALAYVREEINDDPKLLRVHGVNISIGYDFDAEMFACGQSPLCVEVDRLVRSGVVVVVAAGNTGYGEVAARTRVTKVGLSNTINDPGNALLAITVGATHRDSPHTYGVSFFSSKGPTGDGRIKPDLVAPGERITSCASEGQCAQMKITKSSDVGAYVDSSGTSLAAPHVSGAIAAFLSIRQEFIQRPEEVKRIFLASATSLGRERYFEGHGLVDLMRAIQSV
jgi:serine protease AprX